ncbi:MAG: FIST C-terminal domain-containing protein [Calditrichaceae bacterium]|nr:FIST C-terminal domain-containing protein [Calditrichaceae bacterium]
MLIETDTTGTVTAFEKLFTSLSKQKIQALFILACDGNGFTSGAINPILKSSQIPVFGGIFPQIIYGHDKLEKGTIIAGLNFKPNIAIIPNLSDINEDYEEVIDENIPDLIDIKTMFVFVDGFSKRISALIDGLFNIFGLEFNYIGGGAGSLSFEQKPCLFSNEGLIADSALLVSSEIESGIGVSHGWKKISGPFKVTESDRNIIKTLDWKPAFQVYRGIVEDHSRLKLNRNNFFDIAKSYPFGIAKLGAETIVRDPFQAGEDNSLICIGEVPEGSFLDILTGDNSSLIAAARNALITAKESCNNTGDKTILFMDCISRVLYLEDDFKDELNAIDIENIPMIGALTIGEIANSGRDYLEFYNKTAVIGILQE